MKLTNNRYEVTFTAKGGEIKSFTDLETGIQYMWQGHPDYWTGKNPGLFPLVAIRWMAPMKWMAKHMQ